MSNYIGPKQRPIVDALKAGGVLLQANGEWSLREVGGAWYVVDGERCLSLYTRGFLMNVGIDGGGRIKYALTDKGRQL